MPRLTKPRVAFQGERGAYGDDAIQLRWRGDALPIASWSFDDVIRAVVNGKADYGVIPIANTIVGAIQMALDALRTAPILTVVDEIEVEIRHALLAPACASLATITSVASHPVALAQCKHFFAQHPHLKLRDAYDTAGAAREIAAHASSHEAAIAGLSAARRYNLQVLAEDIQDVPHNRTRFAIVQRVSASAARRERW
jgi:prephenate dehydratase